MRYGLAVAFVTGLILWAIKTAWGGWGIGITLFVLVCIHIGYYLVTGRRLE